MGGRRYRAAFEGPALFFATTSTYNHVDSFDNDEKLSLAERILFKVINLQCYLLSYVIMPNHVHLMVGFKGGGNQLSKFMHSFKGNIRHEIVGNSRFWQQRFDDLLIKTDDQFRIKLKYIHWNPVKRGLVSKPENWSYSSYRFWEFGEEKAGLIRDLDWFKIE
jgi:putative transposase